MAESSDLLPPGPAAPLLARPLVPLPDFPQLERPDRPPGAAVALPWQLPAGLALLGVMALTLLGARALARRHPVRRDPLDLATDRLAELRRTPPAGPETARRCAEIACEALGQRYQEGVLLQSASRVLQRRAYLRQLPEALRPALLLLLADCVESSYRPAAESTPAEELLDATAALLAACRTHPPEAPPRRAAAPESAPSSPPA